MNDWLQLRGEMNGARICLASRAYSRVFPGNSRYYCEALIDSFAPAHAGTLQPVLAASLQARIYLPAAGIINVRRIHSIFLQILDYPGGGQNLRKVVYSCCGTEVQVITRVDIFPAGSVGVSASPCSPGATALGSGCALALGASLGGRGCNSSNNTSSAELTSALPP